MDGKRVLSLSFDQDPAYLANTFVYSYEFTTPAEVQPASHGSGQS